MDIQCKDLTSFLFQVQYLRNVRRVDRRELLTLVHKDEKIDEQIPSNPRHTGKHFSFTSFNLSLRESTNVSAVAVYGRFRRCLYLVGIKLQERCTAKKEAERAFLLGLSLTSGTWQKLAPVISQTKSSVEMYDGKKDTKIEKTDRLANSSPSSTRAGS